MQGLVDKQRQHIAHLRMKEIVAERTGDADKISRARKAYDDACGALREYLALHPECR